MGTSFVSKNENGAGKVFHSETNFLHKCPLLKHSRGENNNRRLGMGHLIGSN
jgi:hypothetical protein